MSWLNRLIGREGRSLENPNTSLSSSELWSIITSQSVIADVVVNTETALGLPPVWAAVNFLSGTLAGLPLQVFKKTKNGREQVKGGIADVLHGAVNDGMSSFAWRKYIFDQVFTGGRCFTWIEKDKQGRVCNLWPLEPEAVSVKRSGGQVSYHYRTQGQSVVYAASEIIDLSFMTKSDMISHRGPIAQCRDVIAMAIAATHYGARFFQNGGVPPFVITGPISSPAGLQRASSDLEQAVKKAAKEQRLALAMPNGHDLKTIGTNPEKMQLEELQRFLIEQIARVYQLPPVFLQDLTRATFSNNEQQDLHLVKHTLKRWVEQSEQEMNLKLFGRGAVQYVEYNLDGLLRGDFKTRMEGYALGINSGHLMPNEARAMENRIDMAGGDNLYIQGAMVPLLSAGTKPAPPPPAK